MSYGMDQISSWIDGVQSGVYPIRLMSEVAVGGGKTVRVDASLGKKIPSEASTPTVLPPPTATLEINRIGYTPYCTPSIPKLI